MWCVFGEKIKNVKGENGVRNYYKGEQLPGDYEPPQSYIDQKIVVKTTEKKGNKK